MYSISKLQNNIVEVRFKDSFTLCYCTYLFSHYYEDPNFKGKIFTRQELDSFYLSTKGNENWWKKQWAGSNLPDYIFKPFIEGAFKELNAFELDLIELVKSLKEPYYVIMTSDDSLNARDHEIAHALWYTNNSYKTEVLAVLDEYKEEYNKVSAAILNSGYDSSVILDECHAYMGVYYSVFKARYKIELPEELVQKLTAIFKRYF